MTAEVLRGIAEGAVKTAMSIEPIVTKSVDFGSFALTFACIALGMSVVALVFALKK